MSAIGVEADGRDETFDALMFGYYEGDRMMSAARKPGAGLSVRVCLGPMPLKP